MVLHGRVLAHPIDQRRDDWNAWRLAVTQWAGHGAGVTRERTDSGGPPAWLISESGCALRATAQA
jgi:hypothetical protein